jgi:hypothetical protein
MFRKRLASLVVLAGVGLSCGCSAIRDLPLFNRVSRSRCSEVPCCTVEGSGFPVGGGFPVGDGPILVDRGTPFVPPGVPPGVPPVAPPGAPCGPLVGESSVPHLAPAPRLVPQPQKAQPMPFTP